MKGFTGFFIRELAVIRIGSPFRERIVHDPNGRYFVVQGKDIGPNGTIIRDGIVRVAEAPSKRSPDLLKPGEIVFQTRGVSYRAAVVPNVENPMLAAGSLVILTVDQSRAIPEFLVFFLNLPSTQLALRQMATGSTIPNLRRGAIEQLAVPLPSIADQRQFVILGQIIRQQSEIEQRLNALRLQELHLLTEMRAAAALDAQSREQSTGPKKSTQHKA